MRRFGLSYFPKDTLIQFVLYIEGIFNLKVLRKKDWATHTFIQSLTATEHLNNDLCRKALLRLSELFKERLVAMQREAGFTPVSKDGSPNLLKVIDTEKTKRRKPLRDQPSLFLDDEPILADNQGEETPQDPEYVALQNKISWVEEMLSKHYVKRRSIHFVLDCKFEHFRQQEKCTRFIQEVYKELNPDDIFGLLCLEQGDLHNIQLENAGKNKATKLRVLEDLNDQVNFGSNTRKGLTLAQALDTANHSSKSVPTITLSKRGFTFTSPTKWVVAFLGS